MISREEIHENLKKYDKDKIKIATLCSHTALQIFAGAKQEGIETIGICPADRTATYKAFPYATPNKFIEINDPKDIVNNEIQDKLIEENAILIPHGSFVAYVGANEISDKLYVPMLGNRKVLEWESSRDKQREWLEKHAGLEGPKVYHPGGIDKLCLVKFSGAKGGRTYFKVMSSPEFHTEIEKKILSKEITPEEAKKITIQEFIMGTRYYFHFFYSPLNESVGYPAGEGHVELTGIDRRDETNADELQRLVGITPRKLEEMNIVPSYVVVGNRPLVLRESLLPKVFEMGKKVVDSSLKLFPPGMVGPFCLEAICTPELKFITFEISARIVAGTNVYVPGSPYSHLASGEFESVGRRIAREIKKGKDQDRLDKIIY
jgi:5-formaminoimidazole-4-carboxamide-1-(beta)-D-ribofuranosyl 5'-monophosphate synthetase